MRSLRRYHKKRDTEKRCHAPFEAEYVAHRADSEVQHHVYSPSVAGVDEVHPVLNGAPMRVNEREIYCRITFRLLWYIEEYCASDVYAPAVHALEVIQF